MRAIGAAGGLVLCLGFWACSEGSERPSSLRDAEPAADGTTEPDAEPLRPTMRVDAGGMDLSGSELGPALDGFVPPDPESCTGPGCGPRILSLSTNVNTLRSDQQLIVTAVVSDPDGIDDLIGGTLIDPDSGGTYGAFQTSASEGAYALSLSWAELDTVHSIDAPNSGVSRSFVARFFDADGHETDGHLEVTLRCAQDRDAACDGVCVDLSTHPEHCGACRSPVPNGATCDGGAPACFSSSESVCNDTCVDLSSSLLHCGVCGHACPPYPGRSISCWEDGVCSLLDSRSTAVSCNSVCAPNGYICGWTQWVYGSGGDTVAVQGTCAAVPATMDADGRALAAVNCGCRHYPPANGCTQGPEDNVAACTDGCSNDGDRYIDCEDFDCCPVVSCAPGTACGDRG